MSALRVAVVAAILAVVLWALKAIAIGVAGGLDESPLEGPLFVAGLLALCTAFGAAGVVLMEGRSTAFKVAGAVIGVAIALALVVILSSIMSALIPDSAGWVQEEVGLWLAALLGAALIAGWLRSRQTPQPAVA